MTSQFPGGDMPGMAAMNDTLSFVKKLWGGMQVPGMIAPTVSIDDLDKKIKDLKTVESWLNVNMNMLRGTIQALEVQRATIATLNSLGASFSNAMHTPATPAFAEPAADAGPKAVNPEWPMPPSATTAPAAAPSAAEPEDEAEEGEEEAAADGSSAQGRQQDTAAEDAAASQFVNPAAWWTLLQDQFKQAVSNAMAGELTGGKQAEQTPAPAAKTAAAKPASRSAPKPAAKTAAKATSKTAATAAGASPKKVADQAGSKRAATAKGASSKAKSAVATPRRVTPKA
ncbi:PhaM family polyhydroxyalkanoate granule multifunctional regulatory protein [Undibacterium sp. TJN25]|uniref:PhaM family polyhydroxyalkanoate granule multifunctional regulatory protein n=1 Tax=Undibacterium sp. TJN25 TaxID=3413056 RepID=UPI003BF3725B